MTMICEPSVKVWKRPMTKASPRFLDLVTPLDGTDVFIGIAPWILRQLREVATDLPFLGDHADGRLFNQRFEALFRGGIDTVIQLVELQCAFDISDLYFRCGSFGVIGSPHNTGHNQRREDGQDGHDYHDLDERKALGRPATLLHEAGYHDTKRMRYA